MKLNIWVAGSWVNIEFELYYVYSVHHKPDEVVVVLIMRIIVMLW